MKNNFFLLITISMTFSPCFCQLDEIRKSDGGTIVCKVDSISSSHIFYHFQNESDVKYISKINSDYIRYNSGRFYKIENREKFPIEEKESFIKNCFQSSSENTSDTNNPIKKLNYCLSSFKTIESKISYKDFYKLNTGYDKIKNDVLLKDFMLDVLLLNRQELGTSPSFLRYQSLLNANSKIVCDCINQINKFDNDISKRKLFCDSILFKNWIRDKKKLENVFYSIFKDTTINYIGYIVGKTLVNDIEKTLYDDCEIYLKRKIDERQEKFDKYRYYNTDSLKKELKILLNQTSSLDGEYYERRGLLYFYLKEFDKSISDYNESYKIKPRNSVLYFKSELYDYLNEYDISIEILRELIKKTNIGFQSRILLLEKLKSINKLRNNL